MLVFYGIRMICPFSVDTWVLNHRKEDNGREGVSLFFLILERVSGVGQSDLLRNSEPWTWLKASWSCCFAEMHQTF